MFCAIAFVVILHFTSSSTANSLDPNVFRSLPNLQLPSVGNDFNMNFIFNTYNNILIDAMSYNASYATELNQRDDIPSIITLRIPIDEVNMFGTFSSTLTLSKLMTVSGRNGDERRPLVTTLRNNGRYTLAMRRVHLTFAVRFQPTLSGIQTDLYSCYPNIGEVDMTLLEQDDNPDSVNPFLLTELINYVSKDEYKQMFCNAMRGVISSQDTAITAAIIRRIESAYFPKTA